jgi:hypothetical protein
LNWYDPGAFGIVPAGGRCSMGPIVHLGRPYVVVMTPHQQTRSGALTCSEGSFSAFSWLH